MVNPDANIHRSSARKYGLHSGKLTCRDIEVYNDFEVKGSLVFGDASTDTLTVNGAATFKADSTFYTDKKLQFRDTGIYIQSPADGKITISADGTGADDITLSGTVTVADDMILSTDKKVQFRDSGIYLQSAADGKLTIAADGTGADDITLSGSVTLTDLLTTKGIATNYAAKTADYTTTSDDVIVGVDTSGGAVTITLASATVTAGRIVIIKDVGGSAGTNNITIATEGSETIDGAASSTISSNYGVVRLFSDGTNWFTF